VHELTVTTERHTQLLDITSLVREAVRGASGAAVLVYVPHTTAGLTINEHADPLVARDFEMALEKIAPERWGWQHIEEGEENAPSHIRAALMGPQVVIPLRDDGELALGTWQGIFFCELDGPRTRSVYVTVLASAQTSGSGARRGGSPSRASRRRSRRAPSATRWRR
jgi:secondary thiamine-phosphate synthase enzyme